MAVFVQELKRSRLALIIWTAVIAFMLCITVFIYPQMKNQMADVTKAFYDMGDFSSAFGMDKLNFGEFMGYFAVECGNTLGLGGALFAAIVGISALAKEERDGTSEFLFTQPVSPHAGIDGKASCRNISDRYTERCSCGTCRGVCKDHRRESRLQGAFPALSCESDTAA